MRTAYLMALLEVEGNKIVVKSCSITDSEQLTCQLQKQIYNCLEKCSASTFDDARENLITGLKHKMNLSRPGSIHEVIFSQLKKNKYINSD